MTLGESFGEVSEHETGEGEVVESGEGVSKAFIVSGQPSEPCGPAEAALDDPSSGQEDEASFGFGVLDHF